MRATTKRLEVGVDILTPQEIRALIAALPSLPRWRLLMPTAIFTGLRASELRGLRWKDLDLQNGVVHVRQRIDRYNEAGSPKSKAGTRRVPLPPILVNTLKEWRLSCPSPNGEAHKPEHLVFPTGRGKPENLGNIIRRGLWPAMLAAGLVTANGKPKYTGLHALRHFYASWCINRRADGGLESPAKVVQAQLGHASIVMTLDVYGHLFPSTDTGAELAAASETLVAGWHAA